MSGNEIYPSVQGGLPVNHLACFNLDIVTQLDLTPLRVAYAGMWLQSL
jgi:hypothetical protein